MTEEISQALKNKIMKAATLLARSPLDENIKTVLVEKMGQLSEADLDALTESLERETSELALIAQDFKNFDEKQKDDWEALEKKQREKEFFHEIREGSDEFEVAVLERPEAGEPFNGLLHARGSDIQLAAGGHGRDVTEN